MTVLHSGQPNSEHARYKRLKRLSVLAGSSPVVLNNLLTPEHATYLLGWNQQLGLNRESNPKLGHVTTLYNGMGPDISTPLLATNADTVVGFDVRSVDDYTLHMLTSETMWEKVDADPIYLYFGERSLGVSQSWDPIQQKEELISGIRDRRRDGYWDYYQLTRLGTARCIVIELKKLGINRETIEVKTDSDNNIVLEFDWAYPGEEPKKRKVIFVQGELTATTASRLPKITYYFQKSISDSIRHTDEWLSLISDHIEPGGGVFIGKPQNESKNYPTLVNDNLRVLGGAFDILEIDSLFTERMLNLHTGYDMAYGWKMHCFRRK